ncbi:hypothetical protein Salat_0850800 [Sesamum alatum]|uniref:Uncharacterized protein n=1 Tax=Sesamum alatum TaxID=300844 RepID=A0AAE1YII0_9LAMI|nr:hypothetical protein Salat_0850800 [Sesamum alatum]
MVSNSNSLSSLSHVITHPSVRLGPGESGTTVKATLEDEVRVGDATTTRFNFLEFMDLKKTRHRTRRFGNLMPSLSVCVLNGKPGSKDWEKRKCRQGGDTWCLDCYTTAGNA